MKHEYIYLAPLDKREKNYWTDKEGILYIRKYKNQKDMFTIPNERITEFITDYAPEYLGTDLVSKIHQVIEEGKFTRYKRETRLY